MTKRKSFYSFLPTFSKTYFIIILKVIERDANNQESFSEEKSFLVAKIGL
jgi:hypothetical protein